MPLQTPLSKHYTNNMNRYQKKHSGEYVLLYAFSDGRIHETFCLNYKQSQKRKAKLHGIIDLREFAIPSRSSKLEKKFQGRLR